MRKNNKKNQDCEKAEKKNSSPTLFDLGTLQGKKVTVDFTAEEVSSDGGLLLLREVENQIRIIERLASCIEDTRHQSYVKHSMKSLMSQRIYQIAAGYEDTNDSDALKEDSIIKICSGKQETLAAQPTICRFENTPGRKELYNMAVALADHFIDSYTHEPPVIILDCDDTNSNTYGDQQYSLFNDYYGEYCYMPLHIYEGLSGKLITTILKPGRRSKNINVYSILSRLIRHLRASWKNTIIVVRGDSHFCCKELMDWAYGQKAVHFITGLTGNPVLNKLARVTIESAEGEYKQYGNPVKRFHSFEYQASSWEHPQRVVVKVEANSMGTNIRYIVTDMRQYKTRQLYEIGYCARGGMELRIKDHKLYLHSDRMSCNSFLANQMRLFLYSAAYILIHTLQKEMLRGTEYFNATMKTIQLKLIKIAARVKFRKTKIHIELPKDFAGKFVFEKIFGMFEMLRC